MSLQWLMLYNIIFLATLLTYIVYNKLMHIKKFKTIPYIVGFAVIPLFFVIMTLMMTLSGEDILHKTHASSQTWTQTVHHVYNYLPRLGEFFQRLSIEFYDYQVNDFGIGTLLRLFDALICVMLVYVVSMVIVGRRLELNTKDCLVAISVFLALILFRYNEVFMMRFSYLHNYLPILLSMAMAIYILFYVNRRTILAMLGSLVVGFVLGMSSEIVPIAFLTIITLYVLYKLYKKVNFKKIITTNVAVSVLTIGIIVGMAVMMSNGAIFNRGSQAYAEVYDYVGVSGLISETKYTLIKLINHFMFNGRYILIAIFAMFTFLLGELFLLKMNIAKDKKQVMMQLFLLCFAMLYLAAASQLSVLDDLYARFMSPVFLSVVMSFGLFIYHIMQLLQPKDIYLKIVLVLVVVVSLVATIDLYKGMVRTKELYGAEIARIKNSEFDKVCFDRINHKQTYPSLIFQFTTLPPFEEWTIPINIYNKKIYIAPKGDIGFCK